MKKLLLYSLSICLLAGCKQKTDSGKTIHIDLKQKVESIQGSGIIKSYDVVRLNAPADIIIGDIDKIVVHDDLIYIADYNSTHSVYIFDREGGFKHKISRLGRGPKEYLNLGSIFVDEYDGTFNILSTFPAKILKFGLDGTGEPQELEFKNGQLSDMVPVRDYYVGYTMVSSKDKRRNIHVYRRNGELVDEQVEFPDGWDSYGLGGVNVFSKYNDRLYFNPFYNSTVYETGAGKILFEPGFDLDFGIYRFPSDIQNAEDYRSRQEEFIRKINNYQETDDYWLFHFVFQGQHRIAAAYKSGGSKVFSLDSNKTPYLISFGQIKNITQKEIITTVQASSICHIFEDEELQRDYPGQIRVLKDKIGEITLSDNPVVIIYKL